MITTNVIKKGNSSKLGVIDLSKMDFISGIVCSWVARYVALFVPNKTRLLQYVSLLLILSIAST